MTYFFLQLFDLAVPLFNFEVFLFDLEVFLFEITTGFWGKYSDMVDEMQNSNNLMTCIKHLYKERTNIGENLDSIITKEINISAEKALQWGLLTGLT